MWAVQKEATEVQLSFIDLRKQKTSETKRFQEENMDIFLKKEHVLVYVKHPSDTKEDRFFFKPAKKTSEGERLEDAYWQIEKFKSMKIVGNKFVYQLGFKRFEDEYSVISANIPNMPEKENFRRQWLREHPVFAKRAKKIKRANVTRNTEAPDA